MALLLIVPNRLLTNKLNDISIDFFVLKARRLFGDLNHAFGYLFSVYIKQNLYTHTEKELK